MPTAPQIDAPLSLGGFFGNDDSSDDDDDEPKGSDNTNAKEQKQQQQQQEFDNCYEEQQVNLVGQELRVRQYAFHSHNANRVWPGTFNLAEYLLQRNPDNKDEYLKDWGTILELGTATGLLAIRLAMASSVHRPQLLPPESKNELDAEKSNKNLGCCCSSIVTSDVQDEHGEVEENVLYNFKLNGFTEDNQPIHVPHTWGTGWVKSAIARGLKEDRCSFDTIVASDILLYVSAYGALVETLKEIMALSPNTKFVMSWNRRMKESAEFFERMVEAGFECKHEGKCVYTFTRGDMKSCCTFSSESVH